MDSMVIRLWRIFSNNVLQWIDKHGRDTGYDMIMRNGEKFNLADILTHPIGWAHDLLKYSLELYIGLIRGKITHEKARSLCYKIAHVAQLAVDGVLCDEMHTEIDDTPEPGPPKPDYYGPPEQLQ